MAKQVDLDEIDIPKVDLGEYRFSPPSSMGWSAAEYEKLLNNPEEGIQKETFSPPEVPQTTLTELSLSDDRRVSISLDNVPKDKEDGSLNEVTVEPTEKEKAQEKKAEKSENQEKKEPSAEEKAPADDYIISENPPAKPWLAKRLSVFTLKNSE